MKARKKAANRAGHSSGAVTSIEHLPLGGTQVASCPFDARLWFAHLRVENREAQRQVDHDMADGDGQQ